MITKLIEIVPKTKVAKYSQTDVDKYVLRDIFVNSDCVVCVREHNIERRFLPEDLNENHKFSRIFMQRGQNGMEILVVGEPSMIEQKLNKRLLKG